MSLVGNITSNADRTAMMGGAGSGTATYPAEYTEYHQMQERPQHDNGNAGLDSQTQDDYNRGHITELARELTRQSSRYQTTHVDADNVERHNTSGTESGDFLIEKGTELDPFSDKFNVKSWITRMVGITSRDPVNHPKRTAGVALRNLNVHGFGSDTGFQQTVGNAPYAGFGSIRERISGNRRKVDILNGFDVLLESGDMMVVLGPPGSGCSTLLKTIAGETHGISIDKESYINYQGISPKQMGKNFRGEAIYTAEQDVHFPALTVGDTLAFASEARAHRHPPPGITRKEFAVHVRDVIMSTLGIAHTVNTKVGNEYVRGVSGGERKRVSIAEALLSGAPLQCWDNSTRGLDAANAIEFCKTLKTSTEFSGATACVAIYQSPQAAYDYFNKVIVLYEGYQIYFGPADQAKAFFLDMGFECPEQQSTPDFLTSLTSSAERRARPGYEHSVPQTPEEFHQRWQQSETYRVLKLALDEYDQKYPFGGSQYEQFLASRRAQQAKNARATSPYTLSYTQQIKLCLTRGFWRLKADPTLTFSQLFGNMVMGLIVSSVFYNLPTNTTSFYSRGALLFFAVLLNAFGSALEILTLYAQRPIVEKHERYAFYHPSAEAFASMLTDLPYKILNSIAFNLIIYFMTNLRREPGAFFFFLLISFLATLAMSMFFRSLAALSRSLVQALTPAAGLILALILYTGFALPPSYMLGWISWIRYLNPIYYAFEALMVNEFSGQDYACGTFVPSGAGYTNLPTDEYVCSSVGAVAGSSVVNGDAYINTAYGYYHAHKWRNVGIIIVFIIGLMCLYIGATEVIKAKKSKGEVIVFPRTKMPRRGKNDEESQQAAKPTKSRIASKDDVTIQKQTAIFHWQDVCYDVQIKKETRRILDHVDGWVKPGTLTALMGVSGAGKTTLLDVLATRVTMGVVSGEILVDGAQRDESFQRKTGYCMQQDIHLATSTVREALTFSALLRQPRHIPKEEKLAYVDEILKLLDMEAYQHAVVGDLGEGLNVEQRKRLTIGVELVAKPQLLLFLDEPTSGLDSQTSWNILDLLEKLANHGQAVLCTIHQPSAMLFDRFDRLLFLAKGGKTVYFNEVGKNSQTLIEYFERNGGPKYQKGRNPAEWMLEVIGAAPGSSSDIDWHATWLDSPERALVREELRRLREERPSQAPPKDNDPAAYKEFAAPLSAQFITVTTRVFQQIWRSPVYIYSKVALVSIVGLFIGFSLFKATNTAQGMQNQLFSIFLLLTVFGQLCQQIMPHFVTQRSLYEIRERPSKTYSWKVFMAANILVELPWNTVAGAVLFFCWYYPIGLYRNAVESGQTAERGALMFLLIECFLWFTSTFAQMVIAGIPTAETAGNVGNLIFSLSLIFCGVLVQKTNLGWWIWMYYVSPFTWLVEGMLTTAISGTNVVCASTEYLTFNPPSGETCATYMSNYIALAGGYLEVPSATTNCQFCVINDTDTFLAAFGMYYSHAWRNFGILICYCVFNVFAACMIYYLARVPKKTKEQKTGSVATPERKKSTET